MAASEEQVSSALIQLYTHHSTHYYVQAPVVQRWRVYKSWYSLQLVQYCICTVRATVYNALALSR